MPKEITISFKIDSELARKCLEGAGKVMSYNVREDVTDDEIGDALTSDIESYIMSGMGLEEYIREGVNNDQLLELYDVE